LEVVGIEGILEPCDDNGDVEVEFQLIKALHELDKDVRMEPSHLLSVLVEKLVYQPCKLLVV